MDLNELTTISPVDGRYRNACEELAPFFSESALIRYRVRVEAEYFIALCEWPLPELRGVKKSVFPGLRKLYTGFSLSDAREIKSVEKTTNHDVKAVEYFLKKKFDSMGLSSYREFIHFGLTSQDINNTAMPLLVKEAVEHVYLPLLARCVNKIKQLAAEWKNIAMLARTHGQPASPTRLGKEFLVFSERMEAQLNLLRQIPYSAKFGGATGNFNAHHAAYPGTDWKKFADRFVNVRLGLHRSQHTTQIEHYDNFAALCDNLKRINTILIDFNRDVWQYISMGYFRQQIRKGEVGSSAMPHKVNPIDFENSEGNLGIANALFEHLSAKLPVSRLQRDLTDSTVQRNTGVPFAHTVIAFKSLLKGLDKLLVDKEVIKKDLDGNWAVVAEAIQTILRREGYHEPYEALKGLTRTGEAVSEKSISRFIDTLKISPGLKSQLKSITPHNYTGI